RAGFFVWPLRPCLMFVEARHASPSRSDPACGSRATHASPLREPHGRGFPPEQTSCGGGLVTRSSQTFVKCGARPWPRSDAIHLVGKGRKKHAVPKRPKRQPGWPATRIAKQGLHSNAREVGG